MTNRAHVLLWTDNTAAYLDAIKAAGLADRVSVDTLPRKEKPSADQLARTEALMAATVPPGLLPTMPKLRWAQAMTAGVEGWLALPDLPPELDLTCARGTHTESMPENIIASLFYVAKPLAAAAANKKAGKWVHTVAQPLTGKTLGILGLGAIGQEVARMASAFGMKVIGTRRRPEPMAHVDEMLPAERSDEVLARSDYRVAPAAGDARNRQFHQCRAPGEDEAQRLAAEFRPRPSDQGRRPHRRGEREEDRRRRARRLPPGAAAGRASVLGHRGHHWCCRISAARTRTATGSSPSSSSTISAGSSTARPLKEVVDRTAGY